MIGEDRVLDLRNAAMQRLRFIDRSAVQAERAAVAMIPSDMVRFLAGGVRCLTAARQAIKFAATAKAAGRDLTLSLRNIRILAPVP